MTHDQSSISKNAFIYPSATHMIVHVYITYNHSKISLWNAHRPVEDLRTVTIVSLYRRKLS